MSKDALQGVTVYVGDERFEIAVSADACDEELAEIGTALQDAIDCASNRHALTHISQSAPTIQRSTHDRVDEHVVQHGDEARARPWPTRNDRQNAVLAEMLAQGREQTAMSGGTPTRPTEGIWLVRVRPSKGNPQQARKR